MGIVIVLMNEGVEAFIIFEDVLKLVYSGKNIKKVNHPGLSGGASIIGCLILEFLLLLFSESPPLCTEEFSSLGDANQFLLFFQDGITLLVECRIPIHVFQLFFRGSRVGSTACLIDRAID